MSKIYTEKQLQDELARVRGEIVSVLKKAEVECIGSCGAGCEYAVQDLINDLNKKQEGMRKEEYRAYFYIPGGFIKVVPITKNMYENPRQEWFFAILKNPLEAMIFYEEPVTPTMESYIDKMVFILKKRKEHELIYEFSEIKS